MNKLTVLDIVALALVIVGGINWGLIGLLQWDLVQAILGTLPALVTIVYILVGLAAVYLAVISPKLAKK